MIRNFTRKAIVASKFTICSTPQSKALGLMFSPKPKTLVFVFHPPQKVSLHMWFVLFPIDVLGLDHTKKVVSIKESFMPFSFWKSAALCTYIVELPKGTIRNSKTKLGDFLQFQG